LDRPPEAKTGFLFDIVDLETQVLRAKLLDGAVQELAIFLQQGIESCFDIDGLRVVVHRLDCPVRYFRVHVP
jgi:hypothetical protein